ncbi:hypothetical protein [Bacillus tropicus]|uniref:hypothetical protein n=1 Tax=Bacillus tropicus TaxID=2026188 RepID=UPI0011AA1BD7|nr:hypothetical protein [Bacillus tropicus]
MRRLTYFILTIFSLCILTSCDVTEEEKKEAAVSSEKQVQKLIEPITSNENLKKYLTNVTYEKETDYSDDINLYYNISGTLNDSFEDLSIEEKYNFMASVTEIIRNVNKDNFGKLSCAKDFNCDLYYVKFTTSKQNYKMMYKNSIGLEADNGKQTIYIGDYREYDSKGNLVNNNNSLYESSASETNTSTSDGDDWVKMDASQKSYIVSSVLTSLKSKGYTISEDTDWFVDALNAFYGEDVTNSTKVTEAITLAGFGGKVISKP